MPRAGHGSPSTYRLPIHLSNLRHGNQPVNSRLDTSGMTPLSSRHQRRHGQNKVARAFLTRGTKPVAWALALGITHETRRALGAIVWFMFCLRL